MAITRFKFGGKVTVHRLSPRGLQVLQVITRAPYPDGISLVEYSEFSRTCPHDDVQFLKRVKEIVITYDSK